MSMLYPRLLPAEAERLFQALHQVPAGAHTNMAQAHSSRAVFAATGGRRITRDELEQLRQSVLSAAERHGYPDPQSADRRNGFDRQMGRLLHERSGMVPGEASQRQVWAFLALVLLPDVCAWRWPAGVDGRYTADRFKGSDLTRHALARLWTRAHILRDPHAEDPYELLDVLGEADLDQVMARRFGLAGSPALVRAIVRVHHDDADSDNASSKREILRQTLMRLLRLTVFVDLDSANEAELRHLVRQLRSEVRRALSG